MENIKYYLEAMFANLPNTESVLRARTELLQMMEDKYNELIAEGRSENEAVGTVITEFGNLDELAESLGISSEVKVEKAVSNNATERKLGYEEVQSYLRSTSRYATQLGIGVFLLVSCLCGPIFSSVTGLKNGIGTLFMFLMIAGGIVILSIAGSRQSRWDYIKKKGFTLDLRTTEYVLSERENYRSIAGFRKALGIAFIVFCWLPASVLAGTDSIGLIARLGGFFLFLFVGFGVGLLSMTGAMENAYKRLLRQQGDGTVAGNYIPQTVQYKSKAAEFILRVYWGSIVCLYFILSFLTFRWDLTWLLWPVAAVVYSVLITVLRKEV